MTIATTQSKVTILGNGTTTVFNFPFVADSASDISVIYTNVSGAQVTLPPSTYTLFINPPPVGGIWGVGGTVTYPLSGSPIANGESLTIERTLPLQQTTSISNQGDFYPQVVEAALDELEMQIQQESTAVQYSLRLPLTDPSPPSDLPSAQMRANGYLAFDTSGAPVVVPGIPDAPIGTAQQFRFADGSAATFPQLFYASRYASIASADVAAQVTGGTVAITENYILSADLVIDSPVVIFGGKIKLNGHTLTGNFNVDIGLWAFDISSGGTLVPDTSNVFNPINFGFTGSDINTDTAACRALAQLGCGKRWLGIDYTVNRYIPFLQKYDSASYNGGGYNIVDQNARIIQVTDNEPIAVIRGESAYQVFPKLEYLNTQAYTNFTSVACYVCPEVGGIGGIVDCPGVSVIARRNAVGFHVPSAISDTLASNAASGATSINVSHAQTAIDGGFWWSPGREIQITLDNTSLYTAVIKSVSGSVLGFEDGYSLPSSATSGNAVTAPVGNFYNADTFFDLRDSTYSGAAIFGQGSPTIIRGRIYGSFTAPESPFTASPIYSWPLWMTGRTTDVIEQLTIEHFMLQNTGAFTWFGLASPGIKNLVVDSIGFENIRFNSGTAQYLLGGTVNKAVINSFYASTIAAMSADTGGNICFAMQFSSGTTDAPATIISSSFPELFSVMSDNNLFRITRDVNSGNTLYNFTTNPHMPVSTGMTLRTSVQLPIVRKLGSLLPDGCVGYYFDKLLDTNITALNIVSSGNYTVDKLLVQRARPANVSGITTANMSVYDDAGATNRISGGGADVSLASLVNATNLVDLGVVSSEATKARAGSSLLYAKCGTGQANGVAAVTGAGGMRQYNGATTGQTVTLTFGSPHGLANGWAVISGAAANGAIYNRTAFIIVTDSTHIQYYACPSTLPGPEAATPDTGINVQQIPVVSVFVQGRNVAPLTPC